MNTKKPKPTDKHAVKEHWPNQSKPSKYTYADLSNFHRTILAILTQDKPDTLAISDLTTIQNFVYIVIELIDTPQIFNYNIKENLQTSSLSPSPYPIQKIKGLSSFSKSKKCRQQLMIWMRQIITTEDLTLELLLDEYYNKFP